MRLVRGRWECGCRETFGGDVMAVAATSTHASNGKFAKGNKLGKGNPMAGRVAKIRAELLKSATPQEIKAIARKLVEGALTGDIAYIREFFDRTIGKPSQEITSNVNGGLSLTDGNTEAARIAAEIAAHFGISTTAPDANKDAEG